MSIIFEEQLFPIDIQFKSTGGPGRQTQVVILGSGTEQRNARWVNSRRTYNIIYGAHSMDKLHTVIKFFEAMNGKLTGFRFRDWSDWKSCAPLQTPSATDQQIGVGAVTPTTYQLIKTYTMGSLSWVRTIKKPVSGSVLIALNGVKQNSGWTVDTTTGLVSFSPAPSPGAVITAGYEFDVPARFDTDNIQVDLDEDKAGSIQSLPIIELFL